MLSPDMRFCGNCGHRRETDAIPNPTSPGDPRLARSEHQEANYRPTAPGDRAEGHSALSPTAPVPDESTALAAEHSQPKSSFQDPPVNTATDRFSARPGAVAEPHNPASLAALPPTDRTTSRMANQASPAEAKHPSGQQSTCTPSAYAYPNPGSEPGATPPTSTSPQSAPLSGVAAYGGPAAPPYYPAQPQPFVNHIVTVMAPQKSLALAGALAFFFGPLGLLYSTVIGAIVMFFVNLLVGALTFGFGLFLTWPGCVVWALIAASQHNARVASQFATPYAVSYPPQPR